MLRINRGFLLVTILCSCIVRTKGQDSLAVSFNKTSYGKQDTVVFACERLSASASQPPASLHLFIRDSKGINQWHYRYPLIKGKAGGSLVIGDALQDGQYSFYFAVQREFLRITGTVDRPGKKEKSIVYTLVGQDNGAYTDTVDFAANGFFKLPKLNFTDTAYVILAPLKKNTFNWNIRLETPLDSSFVPSVYTMKSVRINQSPQTVAAVHEPDYVTPVTFDDLFAKGKTTLAGVTVTGIKKRKIEEFDEEVSTGTFKGRNNVLVFDGLESEAIGNSFTLLDFLLVSVPDFRMKPKLKSNIEEDLPMYRGSTDIVLYIDEVKIGPMANAPQVSMKDIAMLKFYPAPSFVLNSFKSTVVAIYTRRGKWLEYNPMEAKKKFKVVGYTPDEIAWNE